MEAITSSGSIPAPPIGAPIGAPMPPPAPMMMETGGASSAPIPPKSGHNFFSGITLMDVGMVALVSLALFYSIYYSRTGIRYFQNMQKQTNGDIASLKSQVAALTPTT